MTALVSLRLAHTQMKRIYSLTHTNEGEEKMDQEKNGIDLGKRNKM
jgi:hypothetical protein